MGGQTICFACRACGYNILICRYVVAVKFANGASGIPYYTDRHITCVHAIAEPMYVESRKTV